MNVKYLIPFCKEKMKKDCEVPQWVKDQSYLLKTQGKLIIPAKDGVDISFFQNPKYKKQLYLVKYLDASGTPLQSLDGFIKLRNLKTFIADGTSISNFKNFQAISSVSKISLKGTPISSEPTYKLSLYLVTGQSLKVIDGKTIPASIIKKASTYPPIAASLVNAGWIAEYPCPSSERLYELCNEHGVNQSLMTGEQFAFENSIGLDEEVYTGDFEETIALLRVKHEEMLRKGQSLFGLTDVENQEADVKDQITNILGINGMKYAFEGEENLIDLIQNLCKKHNERA